MNIIVRENELRETIKKTVGEISEVVTSTFGPQGRNVIINDKTNRPFSTKDGVTVVKAISFDDPVQQTIATLVRQAAESTVQQAGDGTTSSILFLREFLQRITNNTVDEDLLRVKKELEQALEMVIGELKELASPVNDLETIENIATLSANNDPEIGKIIAQATDIIGENGSVVIKGGNSQDTTVEFIEGYRFDCGLTSQVFAEDKVKNSSKMNDCLVFVSDRTLSTVEDVLPLITFSAKAQKPLIVIADVQNQALASLAHKKLEGAPIACVKLPSYGEPRFDLLNDFSLACGASFYSKESGKNMRQFSPKDFGACDSFESNAFYTSFVGLKGSAKHIESRIDELVKMIKEVDHQGKQRWFQERIDRLSTGFAIVNVGGSTEVEVTEKKHRIEDALEAVRAAQTKGVIPGAGSTLLHIRDKMKEELSANLGGLIIRECLSASFEKLYVNSFGESPDPTEKYKFGEGYNFKTREKVNLIKEGIIEPVQVVESALRNSLSVAISLVFTDSLVIKG